jgi:hypothetical protein
MLLKFMVWKSVIGVLSVFAVRESTAITVFISHGSVNTKAIGKAPAVSNHTEYTVQ